MDKPVTQTYNDGVVKIYSVGNIAAPGKMPKEGLTLKATLRYDERVVGMSRYYAAMQNKVRADQLLRCPRVPGVAVEDVAVPNDGAQYKIKQVQYPPDVEPSSMDLTLERVVSPYALG
jgi:hypothetical protein